MNHIERQRQRPNFISSLTIIDFLIVFPKNLLAALADQTQLVIDVLC